MGRRKNILTPLDTPLIPPETRRDQRLDLAMDMLNLLTRDRATLPTRLQEQLCETTKTLQAVQQWWRRHPGTRDAEHRPPATHWPKEETP